ncbi:LamG-like jellyroll fold domain-containing protein [Rubellicoccus peritrichatus]|uniref:LamG-like jellyroll fold domain-containing protein n=1 Tax=Rubellicoccus peritrichatus TaxID=3080537 RepID=A0AAQ3QT37_9BACT|nr:LamG-like jellyroll fold domain-containing protein [Puniceicoccus sp. CR14]WOO43268.1 LamG-like jellyroll fold domain-containing protein [Puniceicoccus sp. CR14]
MNSVINNPIPSLKGILKKASFALSLCGLASSLCSAGLLFEYDAAADTPGNGSWMDEQGNQNLTFVSGSPSPVDVSGDSNYFTAAYKFGGASSVIGGNAGNSSWPALGLLTGSTYEMWVRPTAIPVGDRQILLELGSSFRGLSISLDTDGSVLGLVKNGSANTSPNIVVNTSDITSTLTAGEFVQVVFRFDNDTINTESTGSFFINGVSNGATTIASDLTFQANDVSGLGREFSQTGGTQRDSGTYARSTFTNYDGQYALVRIYDNALSDADILANYNAIAIPEPSTYAMIFSGLMLGLVMIRRRIAGR